MPLAASLSNLHSFHCARVMRALADGRPWLEAIKCRLLAILCFAVLIFSLTRAHSFILHRFHCLLASVTSHDSHDHEHDPLVTGRYYREIERKTTVDVFSTTSSICTRARTFPISHKFRARKQASGSLTPMKSSSLKHLGRMVKRCSLLSCLNRHSARPNCHNSNGHSFGAILNCRRSIRVH